MTEEQVRTECKGKSCEELTDAVVYLNERLAQKQGRIYELEDMVKEGLEEHLKTLREHNAWLEAQL